MKILSVFNNKGGVGKTTLTYHLGHILAEMGKRVLFIDLDPQCNLTTYAVSIPRIDEIWKVEEPFLENFAQA
jgi:cellulose biosynthesis protein BcsQ